MRLGLGAHLVTCSASDRSGNTATAAFTARVVDTTPPTVASAAPSVASLWPPDHQMVPITLLVAASDLVDPAPACSVTSNEAGFGLGDGDLGARTGLRCDASMGPATSARQRPFEVVVPHSR